jgi:PBSX family phage terminase large subunit
MQSSLMNAPPKKIIFRPSPRMVNVWNTAHLATHRILVGAVRSGKSYTANDIAIKEICKLPPCNVLVSGYSISSVSRNIIAEWKAMLDPLNLFPNMFRLCRDEKDEYMRIEWRGLKDKKFYVRGAGKEHDFKQIQGSTFGYWLADELTRHTKSFYDMAMSRLSLPFSKSMATCNPDSPMHYVKKDILENEKLFHVNADGTSYYRSWHFHLQDNPSLTPQYIQGLENLYTGVFYKRYILGMWVLAEGSIYDFFDENTHTRENTRLYRASYHIIGCDYGTADPCVFGLFGVNPVLKPKIWLESEWYFDSRASGRQKSDREYSAAMKNWLVDQERWPLKLYIPQDALSFKTELKNSQFLGVSDTDMSPGSVCDGIRVQARMLKHGDYVIDKSCKHTIADYSGYVWDDKALLKGVEQPLHDNSHTKDMERTLLYTVYGEDGIVDYETLCKM